MKFLFAIFAITLFTTASFADDADTATTTTVVERMTCTQISERISELSAITDPDATTTDEITKLKSDYRRNCSRAAGNRRTNTSGRTPMAPIIADTSVATESDTTTSETDTATVADTTPADTTPEITLEQELANLDAGLCADGTSPNKFGCCGDEKFKDLGNTVFACCPPDGGDCFPPLK